MKAERRRPDPGSIKAVVVDVDGTLTGEDRRMSLEAVSALRRVNDSGVKVMLASGNVLPIAYAVSTYMGFDGPIIAENGGIISYKQNVWVLGDPSGPREAYEYLRGKMHVEKLFTDRWRETEIGLRRETSLEEVRAVLKDYPVEVQTTGYALHIMAKGMNKFRGIEKACELLGISVKQVAAIGDSENDEMMLRRCGVGIAVGDASEESRLAADYVATGRNGEGVVEGLRWLRLI